MAKSSRCQKNPAIGGIQKPQRRFKVLKSAKATKQVAKKPAKCQVAGTSNLTHKYSQRSQRWSLHFGPGTVKAALAALVTFNKKKPFLDPGSSPRVDGHIIHLVWRQAVTGKSLYGFFRKGLPKTLGPQGHCSALNFEPTFQYNDNRLSPTSTGHAATDAAIGAAKGEAGPSGGAYSPLPEEFAAASFGGKSMAWNDVSAMEKALEEHGFIILPGFVPEHITKQALEEATTYFLGVMKSFQHGFGIDKGMAGFDDLASLPGAVWEKQPKKEVTITFAEGLFGMKVGPKLEVLELTPGGQASNLGVQLGWVVVKVGGENQYRSKLMTLINDGATQGKKGGSPALCGKAITFQPPTCFSPLAVSQKWGVATSRGYQKELGLGKSTDPIHFSNCPAVVNTQLWVRNLLASLHGCLPTDLCWKPDGVSFKAGRASFQT